MLVPTSYVSPTLLCKSHPLMLVSPSNVSHNGTNMGQTLHYNFIYRIIIIFNPSHIGLKVSLEIDYILFVWTYACVKRKVKNSLQGLQILSRIHCCQYVYLALEQQQLFIYQNVAMYLLCSTCSKCNNLQYMKWTPVTIFKIHIYI